VSEGCVQARGGRPGGNILDFIALMKRCSIRDAAPHLQAWSGAAPDSFIVPRESRPDPIASENPPLHFALARETAAKSRSITTTITSRQRVGASSIDLPGSDRPM
jgi:hypothetical protein